VITYYHQVICHSSLLSFPALAIALMKINLTLPSFAAVEKLFSAAVQILTVCHSRPYV